MIAPLALAAVLVADPRSTLVELQVQGHQQEALARVDRELAEHPAPAHAWGLDYLRGHLLIRLGRRDEAADAFNAALGNTPRLAFYAYYHFALAQERAGHPEVAAGLIATAIRNDPAPPILGDAVVLLARTLERGGDCRVLQGVAPEKMPAAARRRFLVTQADCAERAGQREFARNLLLALLEEDRKDEAARLAADRLLALAPAERGLLKRLVGLTLVQHRDFARAIPVLAAGLDGKESAREAFETRYAIARAHFWRGRFARAAVLFNDLAVASSDRDERAAALYQRGRSYELLGHWQTAAATFRRAYLASPAGEQAAASLLSAMRLEWRGGSESTAAELYQLLATRPGWRAQASRAALFLAASDVVRGRSERAGAWLDRARAFGSKEDQLEVAYWRGRLAELKGETRSAIGEYLTVARTDLLHPLAQSAIARLASPPLARAAAAEGRRLAASSRPDDLFGAWILAGEREAAAAAVWHRLREALAGERGAEPYLHLSQVPVERWPLWRAPLDTPQEMLLALGLFHEGAPAMREDFPVSEPSIGFTGALLLAAAGETSRALAIADTIRYRAPDRLPLAMQPSAFQTLLYPLPFREAIEGQAKQRGLDPHLLAATIREESRFDPLALSPAAARGLAQFVLPTARGLAAGLQMKAVGPEDLYQPEVSIALGAGYLARLLQVSGGAVHLAVAAYNAGEAEARLWRSYCYSEEREEFFTKVAFEETRVYLRRVLASQVEYARLYP